jgi:hypothetical protein
MLSGLVEDFLAPQWLMASNRPGDDTGFERICRPGGEAIASIAVRLDVKLNGLRSNRDNDAAWPTDQVLSRHPAASVSSIRPVELVQ